MTTTEAIVFTEPHKVDVRTVRLPELGPRDVRVRTSYSGISIGTESWILQNRYKGTIDKFPHIPGYQRTGVVEAVGPEVASVKAGDRVFSRVARLGPGNVHPSSWNGHIGHAVCNESEVIPLPAGTSEQEASFGVQIAVGCLGVRMSRVRSGDFVVVIGQGLIGQMSAQAARRQGATVLTTDVLQKRVDLSAKYSADLVVNGAEEDLRRAVVRESAGRLADVVIEATGKAAMFRTCLSLIRREGTISMQGYYPDTIEIEFHETHHTRASVNFPCAWDDDDLRRVLRHLVDGKRVVQPLITHTFPIQEAAEAYAYILAHPDEVLAAHFTWT